MISVTHQMRKSWCTNWLWGQWATRVNFILATPAHLSILFNTDQRIGTETCVPDTMFPLDHPNFDSGAESSRFTISYIIRIYMHLPTWNCSSRWVETYHSFDCDYTVYMKSLFGWLTSCFLSVTTHYKFIYISNWVTVRKKLWCLKLELLHPLRLCGSCFGVCVLLVMDIIFHK